MQNITNLKNTLYYHSFSAVGGYEESRGPLGNLFDFTDTSDKFGMSTWERAEGEMSRLAINFALKKGKVTSSDMSYLVAGDLQNQCVASSGGLYSFGIPYIGLYGACSTCTESIMVLSSFLSLSDAKFGVAVTSSHNCAAERQFRTPIEYGGQRTPSAQWTATAAGAFVIGKVSSQAKITGFMPGKIVDGYTCDPSSMGTAMALAASDSILSFFEKESMKKTSL